MNGDPRKANAYFKDVNDAIIDSFTIAADHPVGGIVELAPGWTGHRSSAPPAGLRGAVTRR